MLSPLKLYSSCVQYCYAFHILCVLALTTRHVFKADHPTPFMLCSDDASYSLTQYLHKHIYVSSAATNSLNMILYLGMFVYCQHFLSALDDNINVPFLYPNTLLNGE